MTTPSNTWKISAASESKKLGSSSPTWKGIAGKGPSLDRGTRRDRAKKRALFEDSSPSSEDEDDDEDDEVVEVEDDSFARVLLEQRPLKELMERNCCCKLCKGPCRVEFTTVTIATSIQIICNTKACSYIDHGDPPQPAKVVLPEGSRRSERNTDFAVDVLCVLGFMMCGDGGKEAARILGMLGLPRDTNMESRSFPTIEQRIGPTIRQLADDIMLENLIEEVEFTMRKNGDFNHDVCGSHQLHPIQLSTCLLTCIRGSACPRRTMPGTLVEEAMPTTATLALAT